MVNKRVLKMKVIQIGTGGWGKNHCRVLSEFGVLSAICDMNYERAKIGKGCLIGANALITEGMEVPDGSLVLGSPGKIKGELNEDQRKGLILSAQHYVQNAKRFKAELKLMDK